MRSFFFLALTLNAVMAMAAGPTWPITVNEVQLYDDGGTAGYTATDAHKKAFRFCIDGQLMTESPRSFYLNVTHPRQMNAELLANKSRAEREFAQQLKKSLRRQLGVDHEKLILARYKLDPERTSDFDRGMAVLFSKIAEVLK